MTNSYHRDRIDQIDRLLKIALFVRINEYDVMHLAYIEGVLPTCYWLVESIISLRRDCTNETVNNASL